jgi:hypothetical protein
MDVSGSMGTTMRVDGDVNFPPAIQRKVARGQVSRLQCIQAAVHGQLEQMKVKLPNARPSVIAFGSTIEVHGDGHTPKQVLQGGSMQRHSLTPSFLTSVSFPTKVFVINPYNSIDSTYGQGKAYRGSFLPAEKCAARLVDIVDNISELGSTALGPGTPVLPFHVLELCLRVEGRAQAMCWSF